MREFLENVPWWLDHIDATCAATSNVGLCATLQAMCHEMVMQKGDMPGFPAPLSCLSLDATYLPARGIVNGRPSIGTHMSFGVVPPPVGHPYDGKMHDLQSYSVLLLDHPKCVQPKHKPVFEGAVDFLSGPQRTTMGNQFDVWMRFEDAQSHDVFGKVRASISTNTTMWRNWCKSTWYRQYLDGNQYPWPHDNWRKVGKETVESLTRYANMNTFRSARANGAKVNRDGITCGTTRNGTVWRSSGRQGTIFAWVPNMENRTQSAPKAHPGKKNPRKTP